MSSAFAVAAKIVECLGNLGIDLDVQKVLVSCKKTEYYKLDLRKCNLNDGCLTRMSNILMDSTVISKIDIRNNPEVSAQGLIMLAQVCRFQYLASHDLADCSLCYAITPTKEKAIYPKSNVYKCKSCDNPVQGIRFLANAVFLSRVVIDELRGSQRFTGIFDQFGTLLQRTQNEFRLRKLFFKSCGELDGRCSKAQFNILCSDLPSLGLPKKIINAAIKKFSASGFTCSEMCDYFFDHLKLPRKIKLSDIDPEILLAEVPSVNFRFKFDEENCDSLSQKLHKNHENKYQQDDQENDDSDEYFQHSQNVIGPFAAGETKANWGQLNDDFRGHDDSAAAGIEMGSSNQTTEYQPFAMKMENVDESCHLGVFPENMNMGESFYSKNDNKSPNSPQRLKKDGLPENNVQNNNMSGLLKTTDLDEDTFEMNKVPSSSCMSSSTSATAPAPVENHPAMIAMSALVGEKEIHDTPTEDDAHGEFKRRFWDRSNRGLQSLSELQVDFTHYEQLEILVLNRNMLTSVGMEFAEQLGSLPHLRQLDLSENNITDLTACGKLVNLEVLDLSQNQITSLEPLHSLQELRNLRVSGNKLCVIEGLECSAKLEVLDATDNEISSLMSIRSLSLNASLQELMLMGNPICKQTRYRSVVIHTIPHLVILDDTRLPTSGPQKLLRESIQRLSKTQTLSPKKTTTRNGLDTTLKRSTIKSLSGSTTSHGALTRSALGLSTTSHAKQAKLKNFGNDSSFSVATVKNNQMNKRKNKKIERKNGKKKPSWDNSQSVDESGLGDTLPKKDRPRLSAFQREQQKKRLQMLSAPRKITQKHESPEKKFVFGSSAPLDDITPRSGNHNNNNNNNNNSNRNFTKQNSPSDNFQLRLPATRNTNKRTYSTPNSINTLALPKKVVMPNRVQRTTTNKPTTTRTRPATRLATRPVIGSRNQNVKAELTTVKERVEQLYGISEEQLGVMASQQHQIQELKTRMEEILFRKGLTFQDSNDKHSSQPPLQQHPQPKLEDKHSLPVVKVTLNDQSFINNGIQNQQSRDVTSGTATTLSENHHEEQQTPTNQKQKQITFAAIENSSEKSDNCIQQQQESSEIQTKVPASSVVLGHRLRRWLSETRESLDTATTSLTSLLVMLRQGTWPPNKLSSFKQRLNSYGLLSPPSVPSFVNAQQHQVSEEAAEGRHLIRRWSLMSETVIKLLNMMTSYHDGGMEEYSGKESILQKITDLLEEIEDSELMSLIRPLLPEWSAIEGIQLPNTLIHQQSVESNSINKRENDNDVVDDNYDDDGDSEEGHEFVNYMGEEASNLNTNNNIVDSKGALTPINSNSIVSVSVEDERNQLQTRRVESTDSILGEKKSETFNVSSLLTLKASSNDNIPNDNSQRVINIDNEPSDVDGTCDLSLDLSSEEECKNENAHAHIVSNKDINVTEDPLSDFISPPSKNNDNPKDSNSMNIDTSALASTGIKFTFSDDDDDDMSSFGDMDLDLSFGSDDDSIDDRVASFMKTAAMFNET